MEIVLFLKNLLVSWGTAWVLWILLGLSLASVAVIVERWLVFRSRGADPQALTAALDAALARGAMDDALVLLEQRPSMPGRVAAAGLRLASHGAEAAQRGMESAAAAERSVLDRRLAYLGTLGNNAPFVGLFGTVIGVILAFDALGTDAGAAAAGQAASAAVMAAIAEALVATAVGIGVALPAVASYNYFQRRIASMLGDVEALSKLVLAYLSSRELDLTAPTPERREVG